LGEPDIRSWSSGAACLRNQRIAYLFVPATWKKSYRQDAQVNLCGQLGTRWVIREALIRGDLKNLPPNLEVSGDLNNANEFSFYVNKDLNGPLQFHWLAWSQRNGERKGTLYIRLYKPISPQEVTGYNRQIALDVDKNFYEAPVTLVYLAPERFKLRIQGQSDLDVSATVIARNDLPPASSAPGVVFAATSIDPKSMKIRLEASDPAVRAAAVTELAKSREDALPFIDKVWTDSDSTNALKYGTLTALQSMDSKLQSEKYLSAQALESLAFTASFVRDDDLAQSAKAYLGKRDPHVVHALFKGWLTAAGNGCLECKAKLAGADSHILTLVGMSAAKSYESTRSPKMFSIASGAFDEAWEDRRYSKKGNLGFENALLMWGVLLAHRADEQRLKDGSQDPVLVASAKAKFHEFLKHYKSGGNSDMNPVPVVTRDGESKQDLGLVVDDVRKPVLAYLNYSDVSCFRRIPSLYSPSF
jgi:hypothetical protein